jgi:YfiR/HmsC-like
MKELLIRHTKIRATMSILKTIWFRLQVLIKSIVTIILLTGTFQSSLANASDDESLEVKLKAAYIYNFLRFVEWPLNDNLTTNICVYGIKDSYQPAFSSMASLSKKTRKLEIEQLDVNAEFNTLNSCQIIFITDKARNKSKAILEYLKDSNSLTIGESSDFIEKGGMINFIRVQDKVKFEINDDAAKAGGLKIPSKVLRIAERIVSVNSHE